MSLKMNFQQTLLFPCLLLLQLITLGRCIYNGTLAEHGQFKFVVQIKHGKIGTNIPSTHCTGSIISKSWVVTAAHCVADQEYDRLEKNPKSPVFESLVIAAHIGRVIEDKGREQVRKAVQTYIHPEAYNETEFRRKWDKWLTWDRKSEYPKFDNGSYAPAELSNVLAVQMGEGVDMSLLRLDTPFVFNEWVGKVSWSKEIPDVEMTHCTAVGFGRSHDESRDIYNEQNYIAARVGGGEFCKSVMPPGNDQYIKTHHICGIAAVPYGNICAGDSGGPVVCGNVLYGVASKEPNTVKTEWCGEAGNTPMLYTSTAGVKKWIVRTMQPTKQKRYKEK